MLEARLLVGVKKVISDQQAVLTNKSKKSIQKILKQIAKKATQDGGGLPTNKKAKLNSEKSKPAAVVHAPPAKKTRSR